MSPHCLTNLLGPRWPSLFAVAPFPSWELSIDQLLRAPSGPLARGCRNVPRRAWSGTNHLTYSDCRVFPGGDEDSVVHTCPTLLPLFCHSPRGWGIWSSMYAKPSFPPDWFPCFVLDPGTFPLLLPPGSGIGPRNPDCTWPNGLRPAALRGKRQTGPRCTVLSGHNHMISGRHISCWKRRT